VSAGAALREVFSDGDRRYLFGARADLLAFGGAALFSALLLAVGAATGALAADLSPFMWLLLVVGIDAAHVWSTLFRVYLDPAEVRRRALLYLGTPVAVYVLGVLLMGFSALAFWRVVAYLAVWHFMRQQIGWLRLYHRREPSIGALERRLDEILLWLVMLHPVAYWHAHLPRRFAWMIEGDFIAGLSPHVAAVLGATTGVIAVAWTGIHLRAVIRGRSVPWGRALLLITTAGAWYIGIVVFDSDYAFAVTNIPLHGVPYALLTYRYARARVAQGAARPIGLLLRGGAPAFVLILWCLAAAEEFGWDRVVWHDRPVFFGVGAVFDDALVALIVPLLALPQLTHYVLDGFVWRRAGNDT